MSGPDFPDSNDVTALGLITGMNRFVSHKSVLWEPLSDMFGMVNFFHLV